MTDYSTQSTDQLPGDTSPDTERVLYRGRIRVSTSDYTLSGGIYYAQKEIDFGQFKVSNMPNVDVWVDESGVVWKAPYSVFTGSGPTATGGGNFLLSTGDKSSGTSLKLTINIFNSTGGTADLYFQIRSTPSARGSLFPLMS